MSKKWLNRFFVLSALSIALGGIVGCATEPRMADHAFEFDAYLDSPEAEILNYRYGTSGLPGTRPSAWGLAQGKIGQAMRIRGVIQLGDSIYVKWRIRETGEVYEDTVDLRRRLTSDITDHRIIFLVEGAQLFVYLVSPEGVKRPAGSPPGPIRKYSDLKTITIYPSSFRNFHDKDPWGSIYRY